MRGEAEDGSRVLLNPGKKLRLPLDRSEEPRKGFQQCRVGVSLPREVGCFPDNRTGGPLRGGLRTGPVAAVLICPACLACPDRILPRGASPSGDGKISN